jgi:hypothetical protein
VRLQPVVLRGSAGALRAGPRINVVEKLNVRKGIDVLSLSSVVVSGAFTSLCLDALPIFGKR